MTVAVLGSLNLDIVFSCDALPAPGETVLCPAYSSGPGGKGLNQAVAARRAGCGVIMIGAVGRDSNGDALLRFLEKEGIDTDWIARVDGMPTGLAHIMVDRKGENSIVVASGANKTASPLVPTSHEIAAPVYLAQLEVGLAAVEKFFEQARDAGSRTILNAAPAIAIASSIFRNTDVLVLNEHELAQFSGMRCPADDETAIAEAARSIKKCAGQAIIVTLGAQGTQIVDGNGALRIPARPVSVTDTTGAGDCFCGVLAASIAGGATLIDAVERATRAASIAVQRSGAAIAMPREAEIERA